MLKLASVFLAFFLVAQPALVQAQSLTLNRIKALMVEAGFKEARVEDSLVQLDGLGRFDSGVAIGLADDKSTFMISTNWSIPDDKQRAIPALKILTANSYSPFVFALVGDDGELSLNIEATYDSALISKTMLRKAVEQIVETIDGNEEIWNTGKWVAEASPGKPEAAQPAPAQSVPAPQPPKVALPALPQLWGGQETKPAANPVATPGTKPLTMPRLLFVSRKATDFGDVAARPTSVFAQGEPMLVYLEAAGLTVSPAEGGKNRVGIAVDYELRTVTGQVVRSRTNDLDAVLPFASAEQPPIYVTSTLTFTDPAPGAYLLTFFLRDKTGDRTVQSSLVFTIVPAAVPFAAAPPVAAAPAVPQAAPQVVAPPAAAAPPAVAKAPSRPAAPPAKPTITALGSDGLVALGLRAGLGPKIVAAPRIEVRGTTMSAEDLSRLLDPAASASPLERLLSVTAREITVPEIRIETAADLGDGAVVLRDVRLTDVAQGRVGSLTIGGGEFPPAADQGSQPGGFTRLDVASLDLALLSSLAGPVPKEAATEPKAAYRSIAIEGISFPGEASGDVFRIARIASRDVRVRPLPEGWAALFERVMAAGGDDAPAQARIGALTPLADLLDAFDPGSLDVTGFEVITSKPQATTVRMARVGFSTERGPGEIRVDGAAIGTPEGQLRLASFAMEGISLKAAIAGMRSVGASGSTEMGPADMRRLIPQIRAIRFGGADVDLAESPSGPVRFSIGAVELETANPVEGVPTGLRFAVTNFVVPTAAAAGFDATDQIAALGYPTLGLTSRLDLGWNEAARQLVLKELSVDGAGMGSVVARGIIANVSKDVFSPDGAVATVAALSAAVDSLDLEVEDRGLLQRVLAAKAARTGASVESVTAEAAALATLVIPAMLGDRPEAKALGQAVGGFVAKPGRLHVGLKAKQAPGLGVADFQGAADPAALLDKIQIVAEPR